MTQELDACAGPIAAHESTNEAIVRSNADSSNTTVSGTNNTASGRNATSLKRADVSSTISAGDNGGDEAVTLPAELFLTKQVNEMSMSDRQSRHLQLICRLILWANNRGCKLTSGDAFRDPRAHGKKGSGSGCAGYSSSNSQHKDRLAHDFNLFIAAERDDQGFMRGGSYAQDSAAYMPIAKYWESLHPECRSGIRYHDGNHFETVPGFDNTGDPLPAE